MDTHWFSFNKKGVTDLAGRGFRIASAFALLVLTFGPLPYAPLGAPTPVARADNLEWGDVRPPLTDDADSDDTGGFRRLPAFGNFVHATAVAPNGDIFTAGAGFDRDANADGDCADLDDTDIDGDGVCDGTTDADRQPWIAKSVDGGMKWRRATMPTTMPEGDAIRITAIAVSPDYPSDNFVIATFSDVDATGGEAGDGFTFSRDGGLTFPAANTVAGAFAVGGSTIDNRAVALSADFNANDNSGTAAMGGIFSVVGAATAAPVFRINARDLVDGTPATGWTAMTLCTDAVAGSSCPDAPAAGDGAVHLAYSADEEPIILGMLYVDTTPGTAADNFYGMVASGGSFDAAGGGVIPDVAGAVAATATGQVAFDDDYELNGVWYAAVGTLAGAVGDGGVFKFSGTWQESTQGDPTCTDVGFSALTVTGNVSDARIVASRDASNMVCRSSNAGSTWSDDEADGDPDVGDARIDVTGAQTRIASHRKNPSNVFWTTSGDRGGLAKSTNGGTSFRDTGLTNQLYLAQSVDHVSDTEVFLLTRTGGGGTPTSIFWTDNWGTGASWQRVDRCCTLSPVDGVEIPGDYATAKTAWAVRIGEGDERVMRSTDGGRTWLATGSNPTDDESIQDLTARSASTAYAGTDEGHVFVSTDGGSSWTMLAKDFGNDIDEFDFASDTVFFVSAIDSDNLGKVWQTRDGGATFTQLGDSPWGTGCDGGDLNFRLAKYDAAKNEGWGIFMSEDTCTTDEVYRIQIGGTNPPSTWTDLDLDIEWESIGSFTGRAGDGYYLWLWQTTTLGGAKLVYTTVPLTGDLKDMGPIAALGATGGEADNLMLTLPNPPVGTGALLAGRPRGTLRTIAGGRIMVLTATTEFLAGPEPQSPADKASVPANTGDEGVPLSLRWTDISGADAYDVILGQNADLSDGAIITPGGGTTASRFTVTNAIEPLVQGVTYYWAVRVMAAEGSAVNGNESPWSPTRSFTVSTTSPTQNVPVPNLPLNGAQIPGLSTELSWNNPPGVAQVQVQVRPLNDDGPAINLIIGSAISRYVVPAPLFGTGPYVILPGASYVWRTRVTGSTNPNITEADPAFGPWSEPRTFTTRRPDSGTIQLLAPINGETVSDTTPAVQWKNAAADEFYYEVQLSADPNFNMDPRTATAAVFWNLLHGGQSNPPNSWTVPDANALKPGTYYWRVRQRLQATASGSAEVGIAWSPAQRFVMQ